VKASPQLAKGAAAQSLRARAAVRAAPMKVCVTTATTSLPAGHQNSKWPTGVPPQMGGHYLPSGNYAPISQSTTSGTGKPHQFQYYDDDQDVDVLVYRSSMDAQQGLCNMVAQLSQQAIQQRGIFTIAVDSAETTNALANVASLLQDFSNWHVLFASDDIAGSNFAAAKASFLARCPVPATQVYTIEGQNAASMAEAYATKIKYLPNAVPRNGDFPVIDLVILEVQAGTGAVAALYPNRPEATDGKVTQKKLVVPVSGGRVHTDMASMSLPLMNSANNVAMLAFGQDTAAAVWRTLEIQALPGALPAQMIRPAGKLTVMLDEPATSMLSPQDWNDWKKYPGSNVPKPSKK